MIRNLLYSLSLHCLLLLVIYINFNSHEFIDVQANEEPITISFVAIEEEEVPEIIEEEKEEEKIEEVQKEEPKKVEKPKIIEPKKEKPKKEKPKPPKKKKKTPKKKKPKKKVKKKKEVKKKEVLAKTQKENSNIEELQTINLSARERFNVSLQIKRCYRKAILETAAVSKIPVKIKVELNLDGTFKATSLIILNEEEYKTSPNDLEIALENVKKALKICSPIRNLPKDKYDIWKDMELSFDSNS